MGVLHACVCRVQRTHVHKASGESLDVRLSETVFGTKMSRLLMLRQSLRTVLVRRS